MTDPLPTLLSVGLLFFISIVCGKIANVLKTPRMVGYLIAGIIFGPSFLGLFSYERIHGDYAILVDFALAVIAFSMGEHLRASKLKGVGKDVIVITLTQGFAAAMIVGVGLYYLMPLLVNMEKLGASASMILPVALVIGAASAATAPAAIMSLVGEYKAKGHFKNVLLGVVALDDVVTIILYGFAITFAADLVNSENLTLLDALWNPTKKILLAAMIGAGAGFCLKLLLPLYTDRGHIFALMLGTILVVAGVSRWLGFSPLLASLILGVAVANMIPERKESKKTGAYDAFLVIERIQEAIFGIFFLLAGAHIDFSIIEQVLGFAVIITLLRFSGKIAGCWTGAWACGSDNAIRRYLGIAMLPAAGVMVGLALDAGETLNGDSRPLLDLMVSAVLGATLLNELITPFFVRYALKKSGSIK
jgi:Kef-type K+ transport system membrane component KefB